MSKVLFVMRATTHFHYYESILRSLLDEGYKVEVFFATFGEWWSRDENLGPLEEFKKDYPKFSYKKVRQRSDFWRKIIPYTRSLLAYHVNLNMDDQPRYYKNRFLKTYPKIFRFILLAFPAKWILKRKLSGKFLRFLEKLIPADANAISEIKNVNPDAVLASSGNLIGDSIDVEYLKAAACLKIPTLVPVISWDYLTTKGGIYIVPDELLLWNKFHFQEALKYHGIPREKMKIIGASVFDKWLLVKNPTPREEFAKQNGLRLEYPIITYLGSSPTLNEPETWVVERLRKSFDESEDEKIRNTQIIIRPHPANWKIYEGLKLENTIILPKIGGKMPDTEETRQLFYDTIFHSVFAVGINTSGMIDAIVIGKPVIALLLERYKSRQSKTRYFKDFLASGSVVSAKSPEECPEIIKNIISGNDSTKSFREAFINESIRPLGRNISAGEAVSAEIERVISSKNNSTGIPLVSIGLPTYNRAIILRRTLDSLLGQTYKNFELIISDDESSDETQKVCMDYAGRDSRIRYIRQKTNLGVKGNFYFVLNEARGKYFLRAGDDDWWAPEFLEKLILSLQVSPKVVCSTCSFARVYNNGEVEENIFFNPSLNEVGEYEIFKKILMRKKGFDHLYYGIVKIDVFRRIALRRPPDKGWDAILCSELALAGKIYFNSEILRFSNNKLESPGEKQSKISPRPSKGLKKFKLPLVSTTYANLFFNALWRGFSSTVVPFRRKIFLVFPWLSALFLKRKKIFGFFYGLNRHNYSK